MLADSQLKLLAEFLSNMAVVWFAAAFVAPMDLVFALKASLSGLLTLYAGLSLAREVRI